MLNVHTIFTDFGKTEHFELKTASLIQALRRLKLEGDPEAAKIQDTRPPLLFGAHFLIHF